MSILAADHPRDHKALGRKVKNFDDAKWKIHGAQATGCSPISVAQKAPTKMGRINR